MAQVKVPNYSEFMNPVIQALKELGGSGTIEEINNKVIDIAGITDEQLEESIGTDSKKRTTIVENRISWTRTYLKKYGILENSSRGVWALTPKGRQIEQVDPKKVKQFVTEQGRKKRAETIVTDTVITDDADEPDAESKWRDELLSTLLEMHPSAFERLVRRLLRESGFTEVEVTGQSGDGGIDGKGIMRLGGLLSFHVIFQCKRYQGSVAVGHVRDFRGAMVGRADKGLFITTGNFTKAAKEEATRDGAPAIDLIDGDLLMDKLKELELGVKTEKIEVERVIIDKDWLLSI